MPPREAANAKNLDGKKKGVVDPAPEVVHPVPFENENVDTSITANDVLVFDVGSYRTRVGHAGEAAPRTVFPTVVGHARNVGVCLGTGNEDTYIGHHAVSRRGILTMSHPMGDHGSISNWDDMQALCAHAIYHELCVVPEEHCILLSEVPALPTDNEHTDRKANKEKWMELMFETLKVRGAYSTASSSLAMYAYGRTTGLVVQCGQHRTSAIPVHEGYTLTRQASSMPIGGHAVSTYLARMFDARGFLFTTSMQWDLLESIKKTKCSILLHEGDFVPAPRTFFLPDGQEMAFEREDVDCAEILFDFARYMRPVPEAGNVSYYTLPENYEMPPLDHVVNDYGQLYEPHLPKGVDWITFAAIHKIDAHLRSEMFQNIVLAGGSSLFPGFASRLENDLMQLYRDMHPGEAAIPINVHELPSRENATWLGGSMLASIPMFHHMIVTREQYEEYGSLFVASKFF